MSKTQLNDFELHIKTLLVSYDISVDLEANCVKELLPIFANAKKAYFAQFVKLRDLPKNVPASDARVKAILKKADDAFVKIWRIPALNVIGKYTRSGYKLGEIQALSVLKTIDDEIAKDGG